MHVHVPDGLRPWLDGGAWALAVAWMVRTSAAARGLPEVEDLTDVAWDVAPRQEASLVVVVPARDEAESLRQTLDCLLAADYPQVFVVGVDDRSTDGTGKIFDKYAKRHPQRVGAIHVTELPEGWLGKVHAMQAAVDATQSDWVLFTDADVMLSPSILRRTLAFAESTDADHVVVMPTPEVKSWTEGLMLGFLQLLGFWAVRLWRVRDDAVGDAIGVGAFNLVRRSALEEMGGLLPQRLTVLEDVTLGRRIKAAGLKQEVAFAPGLVLVHWAKGARGIVRVMTKNLFSGFGFRAWMAAGALGSLAVLFLGPLAGMLWWVTLLPSALSLLCVAAAYRMMGQTSLIPARHGWLYPAGVALFAWAMVRSIGYTWWHGGIEWRGTVYPLSELRSFNDPFVLMRERWDRRDRERRGKRGR